VRLPAAELLSGRGLIAGAAGAGKSNTASVIAENVFEAGHSLLIVDTDGEYYGLKEQFAVLHVGADAACDVQVTPDQAESVAALAIEESTPVILDIASFLDQDAAGDLLAGVAEQLFAKARTQRQPFLVLVEELHEWLPEQGSMGECGQRLLTIAKRGHKHGLGIAGITQRPTDVDSSFLNRTEWQVYHRLTANSETNTIRRKLDAKYANAVPDLADGEAFLNCDWDAKPRRVQFHRKQTFDAGARPGLDGAERPALKDVPDELVGKLQTGQVDPDTEGHAVAELRAELSSLEDRIASLERRLETTAQVEEIAVEFSETLVNHLDSRTQQDTETTSRLSKGDRQRRSQPDSTTSQEPENTAAEEADDGMAAAFGMFDDDSSGADNDRASADSERASAAPAADSSPDRRSIVGNQPGGSATSNGASPSAGTSDEATTDTTAETTAFTMDPNAFGSQDAGSANESTAAATNSDAKRGITSNGNADSATPRWLEQLQRDVREMEPTTRDMLATYLAEGPETPLDAHFSAGGSGDRTMAYAHNRRLRLGGYIEHTGQGRYEPALASLVREESDGSLDSDAVADAVTSLRAEITTG
jgi:hypothetical protein